MGRKNPAVVPYASLARSEDQERWARWETSGLYTAGKGRGSCSRGGGRVHLHLRFLFAG